MNSATPSWENPLSSAVNPFGLSYSGVKSSTQGYNGWAR